MSESEREDKQVSVDSSNGRLVRSPDDLIINLNPPVDEVTAARKAHWEAQGQLWRSEIEIDTERQKYLNQRRSIPPDIEKGIYPFKRIKLNRADVEWLLATHDNCRGPVDWNSEEDKNRSGLDLRGADLRGADLRELPLARLLGGLDVNNIWTTPDEELETAAVLLSGARLNGAHLESAIFNGAHLEKAELVDAHLERANLFWAQMKEACLIDANLEGANMSKAMLVKAEAMGAHLEHAHIWGARFKDADLSGAYLDGAMMGEANLEGARLAGAHLNRVKLTKANLKGAQLMGAHLDGARLEYTQLKGAILVEARLRRANLTWAKLQKANLFEARLIEANLWQANLSGASLYNANLSKADLHEAVIAGAEFKEANLNGAKLDGVVLSVKNHIGPSLVDVQWGNCNLALADWSQIAILGDEHVANQPVYIERRSSSLQGQTKDTETRLGAYKDAVRAYNQLSIALQSHGLNEDAARFTYRAHLMQRKVYWHQRKFGQYFFSLFLDLLAGYGYRPGRSLIAYALVIGIFATIYYLFGPHLAWNEAIVISMTAFHGRGFFPEQFKPGDPQAMVAAIEAFVGLLIEVTFIATLTQRFFGK